MFHVMKQKGDQKEALFLGAQKDVVGFADGFQTSFQIAIVPDPLLNLGHLLRPNTELFGDAAGISDGKHPNGVTLTAVALGTTLFMPDGALQQRAPEDLLDGREVRSQAQATLEGLLMFHHLQ
jgi:hypothetical protein